MSTVNLGKLSIGEIPRIVGTVSSRDTLQNLDSHKSLPCDIIELTMVNSTQDIAILSALTFKASQDAPVCVIGMGRHGASTRLSLPALGSALAYGYLDKPSAPGQFPCSLLSQRLRETLSRFDEDVIIRKQLLECV